MTPHRDLDLQKVQTPDGIVTLLRAAVEQFETDAANMDGTAFLESAPWLLIAQKLEKAADQIDRGLRRIGYPTNQKRRGSI